MTTPAAALGLEIGSSDLRVIQLNRSGGAAAVTGYAAVARPVDEQLHAGVRQLIEALGPPPATVITIAHDEADDPWIPAIREALVACGLSDIEQIPGEAAAVRASGVDPNPAATGFVDCPIPAGLLDAHAQLQIEDLAPAVGAALDRLGLGHDTVVEPPPVIAAGFSDHDAPAVTAVDDAGVEPDAPAEAAASTQDPVEDSAPERLAATIAAEREAALPTGEPPVGVGEAAAATARLELGEADDGPLAVRPLAVVLAFVAVIALGLIAWLIFGSSDSDDVTDTATVASTSDDDTPSSGSVDQVATDDEPDRETDAAAEPTEKPESETTAPPDPTPAPEPTAAPDPTPSATAEPDPTPEAEDPLADLPALSELPARGAVFVAAEQKLYLRGPVTEQEGLLLEARAIEVLGPDRVVNEYIYRPDAPPVTEGNVRVEQAVLFETGSAVIAEPFIPTLELGVLVMALNPQVTMVIEGHTDSVGSDEDNLVLSVARAEAVADYLVSRGVERDRLIAIGLGETEPIADNETDAGRQVNRRIEVELLDLIAPRPDAES